MSDRMTHSIPAGDERKTVVVIGGGAGGMLAAGRAAQRGARVILLEKTGQLGQKLLVSGKTRCNLTNSKPLKEFIAMYGSNGRFLYGAFDHFFRDDLLALLERYGVQTKVERGGRIFPASDDARDVAAAFRRYLDDHRVEIRTGVRVTEIMVQDARITGVMSRKDRNSDPVFLFADAVILATGGATWPGTGSTGDGLATPSSP